MKKIFVMLISAFIFSTVFLTIASADYEPVEDTPYGIPIYDSVDDVDLSVVFAGHGEKRLVDLCGGFVCTTTNVYPGNSMAATDITKSYHFYDTENWDTPQYIKYDDIIWQVASSGSKIADGFSLLIYDKSLTGDELVTYYFTNFNNNPNIITIPMEDDAETILNSPFLIYHSGICDAEAYYVIEASLSDGLYTISFEPVINNSDAGIDDSYKVSSQYVMIEPETSLIKKYGYHVDGIYQDGTEYQQDVSCEVNYGLAELPDYSAARATVLAS